MFTGDQIRVLVALFEELRFGRAGAQNLAGAAVAWSNPGHPIIWGVSNNRPVWCELRPGREIGDEPIENSGAYDPDGVRAGFEALLSKLVVPI